MREKIRRWDDVNERVQSAFEKMTHDAHRNPGDYALDYEEPQRYEPRRERQVRYAHISIVGLSIAWIIKAIGLH